MDFSDMIDVSMSIKDSYDKLNIKRGEKKRNLNEYLQGFVGDVGNLSKLIMAKTGFRTIDNVDEKLRDELSDCLRSIIVIAHELDIDLKNIFWEKMSELKKRIEEKEGSYSESL